MKHIIAGAVFGLLSACVAVVPIPIGGGGNPAEASRADVANLSVRSTASFTRSLNDFRASQGVGPLRQSSVLTLAAQRHAEDMRARDYFSHRSPGGPHGSSLIRRAQAAGCRVSYVSENIGKGQDNEQEILQGWAESPGHRRNMLNTRVTEYGLGRAGDYWVLNLSNGC